MEKGLFLVAVDRDVVRCARSRAAPRGSAMSAPARRRDDLKIRVEGPHADVEAHLVVALAGAAVSDRLGVVAVGRLHELLGDQRPADGRRQRVLVLIEGVGHEGRQTVMLGELLFGVDGDGGDGAGRLSAGHGAGHVLDAADVDEAGDHLVAVVLLQPGMRAEVSRPPE